MLTSISIPTIFITNASKTELDELLAFHQKHLTAFLFPREKVFFKKLIIATKVFIAREKASNDIVGVCYIDNDSTELCKSFGRHEFGGLYIVDRYIGTDLSTALCIIAITHNFTYDRSPGRIVSHIHELNTLPLKLFKISLHFDKIGFEVVPRKIYKDLKNMDLNNKLLVGELYSLLFNKFQHYYNWMKEFKSKNFQIHKNSSVIQIESDLLSLQFIDETIDSLELLSRETTRDVHLCKTCKNLNYLDYLIRYNKVIRFFYTFGLNSANQEKVRQR